MPGSVTAAESALGAPALSGSAGILARPVRGPVCLALLAVLAQAGPARAGTFYAAAGKADITPDLKRETVWLAGYGASGRKAEGVHDPLYARGLVVSDGTTTVAMVGVDLIGLFREDVEELRRRLGWTGPRQYLFVSATHQHSGPDTLGLWGRWPGVSGVDSRYRRRLLDSIVSLVGDLSSRLVETDLSAAKTELDPRGLCRDIRDPVVLDPELNVLQFRAKTRAGQSGKAAAGLRAPPIATLVRWSCHPEALREDNRLLTADYPGELCARVEEKTGGACLFQSGSIGGLLIADGDRSPARQFSEAARIGRSVAEAALKALAWASRWGEGRVSFSSRLVRIPVENSRYLLFLRSLTFGHRLLDAEGRTLPLWKTYWLPLRHLLFFPLPERLRPWVESEVSRIRLGQVEILGIPGEIFPELVLGGYDGRYRFGYPLIGPANPNPPRLTQAPKAPFLRERLKARHGLVVGLANDELGYIVPEYDFQITDNRSLDPHPPGTHYEETNSIGRRATRLILDAAEELSRESTP